MGFLRNLFGSAQGNQPVQLPPVPTMREEAEEIVREAARDAGEELVEVEVKGESHHQAELERIAGPKGQVGKQELVGVTLRCEPENQYDANAIRVEVMGQLVAHVAREIAVVLSGPILRKCGGALEARGLVVGGWKAPDRDQLGQFVEKDEGSFGIRVWITTRDTDRLEVYPDDVDPSLRPPWPTLPPPEGGEIRFGPSNADRDARISQVTVTFEEHYQDAIVAAKPDRWRDRSSCRRSGCRRCHPCPRPAFRWRRSRRATPGRRRPA